MFPNIEFIDFRSFQINWNIFVFKLLQIHTRGNIFSIQSKLDAFCLSAKQNRTTVIATIGSIEFDNRTDRKVRVRLCLTTEPIEQQSNRLHSIDNAGYRTRATVSNWNSNVALFIVQTFQPSRFDRESPDLMCCLPLSRFLSGSPDLS